MRTIQNHHYMSKIVSLLLILCGAAVLTLTTYPTLQAKPWLNLFISGSALCCSFLLWKKHPSTLITYVLISAISTVWICSFWGIINWKTIQYLSPLAGFGLLLLTPTVYRSLHPKVTSTSITLLALTTLAILIIVASSLFYLLR